MSARHLDAAQTFIDSINSNLLSKLTVARIKHKLVTDSKNSELNRQAQTNKAAFFRMSTAFLENSNVKFSHVEIIIANIWI